MTDTFPHIKPIVTPELERLRHTFHRRGAVSLAIAARQIGMTPGGLFARIYRGSPPLPFPVHREGVDYVVDQADIDAYLAERNQAA